jgi:hypothetical protein
MSSKLLKRISALAAATLACVFILGVGRSAGARSQSSNSRENGFSRGQTLVGTWNVKVQQYNCQTEAPVGPSFAALLTFNDGGTMTESTTNPAFAIGQRGPGHGIWSYEGRHTYSSKDVAFFFFTTPPVPQVNPGFLAGTQTLTQTIEFKDSPDEFTSDATTDFADATGKIYRSGCASAVAQRMQ